MAKKSTELVKNENGAAKQLITTNEPDYLSGKERKGTEALGQGDYKIPRIKLLQPLSPEVRTFQGKAIPDEFWHTGANKNLSGSFIFVPCIVSKRVVLWRPQDDGDGGILAFSRDCVNWDTGGDTEFSVKLKDVSKPVKWRTKKNVQQSGLLEFGTSNPEDEKSAPAATLIYEYLCYLPDYPELSPVVLSCMRTGVQNARSLNTYLLSQNKPINCMAIKAFADKQNKGKRVWTVPTFEPAGYASREIFLITEEIKNRNENYQTEIEQEDTEISRREMKEIDDSIQY